MTRINNRRPTILLTVLALAGALLVLTAFPERARAAGDLLSATLVVGSNSAGTTVGFSTGGSYGSLSDTSFSYRGSDYTIGRITYVGNARRVFMDINPALPRDARESFTLHLGSVDIPLRNPDTSLSGGVVLTYANINLSWSTDDSVSVSITADSPWTATLDAKDLGSGFVGCNSGAAESVKCTSALSEDDFSYDGDDFTVQQLAVSSSGSLRLSFADGNAAAADDLTLYVGGDTFYLGAPDTKNAFDLNWDGTGLAWDAGDTISLELVEPSEPDRPSKLSAAPHGQNRIDLSWKPPASDGGAPVTGYRIEVQTDGGSWSDRVADTDSTDTEYSHTRLSAGAERRYRVSAINASGASGPSSTASTTTCAAGTFWCADLTVASFVSAGEDVLGYDGSDGSLKPEGIERGSQSASVTFLGYIPGGDLIFVLDQAILGGSGYTLHLGSASVSLPDPGADIQVNVSGHGLDWEEDDKLRVSLETDNVGSVSLYPVQHRVGVEITATLTDVDGGVSNKSWQWSSAGSATGTFSDISGAASAAYTPVSGDVDRYLKATVSYEDANGPGRSASAVAADPVLDRWDIKPVSDNADVLGVWSDGTTLWVSDHEDDKAYAYVFNPTGSESIGDRAAGREFDFHPSHNEPGSAWSDGTTMWVVDREDDKLYAYVLKGTDKGDRVTGKEFDFHSDNAHALGVWSDGTTLWASDHEDDQVYAYVLVPESGQSLGDRVSGKEFDFHSDNGSAAGIWSDGATMWVADGGDDQMYAYVLVPESGQSLGDRVTGREFDLRSDNANPSGVWSDGAIMLVADRVNDYIYSYEVPDFPGSVSLSPDQPRVRAPVTASLTDLDGGVGNESWQWSRANSKTGTFSDIAGAASATYTPVWDDLGKFLKATVSYEDAEGPGKSASAVAGKAVLGRWDIKPHSDNAGVRGIWSDGETLWVTDFSDAKAYAYALDPTGSESIGDRVAGREFDFNSSHDEPGSAWSDGTTMWVVDKEDDKLYAYVLEAGSTFGNRVSGKEFSFHSDNADALGIWSDGTTLWVSDHVDDKVYAYVLEGTDKGDRVSGKEFDLHSDSGSAAGIWSDGATMWVADGGDDQLYAYVLVPESGQSLGDRVTGKEFDFHSDNGSPSGVWSDGKTMLVADWGDDYVYSYDVSGLTAGDETPPTLESAAVDAAGTTLTLAFDEDLDLAAAIPDAVKNAFSVEVDGTAVTVSSVAEVPAGSGLTLTLADAVTEGQEVVVGYNSATAGAAAIGDESGNPVVSFTTGQGGVPDVVNNSTVDVTRPTLSSGEVLTAGDIVHLSFDEVLDSDLPVASSFTVSVDSAAVMVTRVNRVRGQLDGNLVLNVLWLSVDSIIYQGQTVVVEYDKAAADAIADDAGNEVDSFTTGQGGVPAVVNRSTVERPNNPPTASDSTVSTSEDTAYAFRAADFNFADADPVDTLKSVTVATLPAAGTLAVSGTGVTADQSVPVADLGGNLTFTPAENGNGAGYASFTFRVHDGRDESASDYTMTIDVTPVNDAPVFDAGSYSFSIPENPAANTNVGAPVAATDPEGDPVTYSLLPVDDHQSYAIDTATGQLSTVAGGTYDHEYEDANAHVVEVRARDSHGATSTILVNIAITDVDEPPSAPAPPSVAAASGSTTSLDVSWTAPDNAGRPDITDYDVRHRRGSSGSWVDHAHTGTGTSTTITGLTEGTLDEIEVQVRAINDEGTGPWSVSGSTASRDAARLRALSVSYAGTELISGFDPDTHQYTATSEAPHRFSQVTVAPAPRHGSAAVEYLDGSGNETADADPAASGHQVALSEGPNTIRLRVTAADGIATQGYTVTVARVRATADATLSGLTLTGVELDPPFNPGTTGYEVSVPHDVSLLTVASAPSQGGASRVIRPGDADPAAGGHQVELEVGENTITVTVRAQNGTDTLTYTVMVNRAEPGVEGQLRLVDRDGNVVVSNPDATADSPVEGRLEVFHAGRWGTVCNDRFERPESINNPDRYDTVEGQNIIIPDPETRDDEWLNAAPRVACLVMGYDNGRYAPGYGRSMPSQPVDENGILPYWSAEDIYPADYPVPIWLDDVTFALKKVGEETYLTDQEFADWLAVLAHRDRCSYAGWGLHDCVHGEDSGLTCWNGDGQPPVADAARAVEPLTARFEAWPAGHDGERPFTFRTGFSEDVAVSAADMRDHALTVTGGTVTGAARVDGRDDLWTFTVAPSGAGNVEILLLPGRECKEAGAICTEDGRQLSSGLAAVIPFLSPLTVGFEDVPESHDGESEFRLRIAFSEEVDVRSGELRDYVLAVSGGRKLRVGPAAGRKDLYEAIIRPRGDGDITIITWLAPDPECGTAGTVCTPDGRALSNSATVVVPRTAASASGQQEPEPESNTPATGAPAINGTAQVGETLTAGTSGIADEDSMDNATFAYQWLADDTDIDGATGSGYTVSEADEGKTIRVRVSFTDDAGNQESLTSTATEAVAGDGPAEIPAQPTGLTDAEVSHDRVIITWDDPADSSITGYVILRRRHDTHAQGEFSTLAADTGTAETAYTDTRVEPEKRYTYRIKAINAKGKSERSRWLHLDTPAAPAAEPNSAATGVPTINGTAQVGETLTADTSGIADEDGLDNVAFGHQWLAGDADIAGATGSTHTLAEADRGKAIRVRVSFTDDAGNEESLTSAATAAVAARPNAEATGAPTISGTSQVGETLTADVSSIADGDGLDNVAFTYQWLADDVDIPGATGSGYTLAESDAGKAVKVRVSFTDDAGNEETLTSAATDAVAGTGPTEPPAKPRTLTASDISHDSVTLTWRDPQDDTITGYIILRRDKDTHQEGTFETVEEDTGTADTTYTDTSVEPEKRYVYRIKAINAFGKSEISSWVRAYTPAAPATENTPATGAPTIGGTARVGETLTADTSGITDEDGLDDASFSYQWLAGDVETTGATNATYTLADADRGKAIRVRVSFTDDAGNEETLTSAATAAVAAKPNSQATGAPTISGTAQVGETLTAGTAGISDEDGLENASFSHQWLAGGTDISGATGSSYILTADEEGLTIRVRVSFTDDAGNEETLTSAPTAAVSGAEPTEPPPPPTNLTAVVNDDGTVTLSWDAPDDDSVTGYQILRRRPQMGEDTLLVYVDDTGSTATTFIDTEVTAGVRHVYRVKAINAAGLSQRSNYARVEP